MNPQTAARLKALEPEMLTLLQQLIAFPSVSGQEGPQVEFLASWGQEHGLTADLWQANDEDFPEFASFRHLPLSGRPTLVLSLPGSAPRSAPSLLFNAHTDVVSAPHPARWRHPPFSGTIQDGLIFGRGACDTKGPMVSALWAILALAGTQRLGGSLLLELIPGEEDCVGLGTATSLQRGYRADASIVLEPTECQPRCASRGGCRFEILCHGRAVHGTVKWLGEDAIALMRRVLEILDRLQEAWNRVAPDPLFGSYPFQRPLTVDRVGGGEWQGMICDRCQCGGYMELLPKDDLESWKKRLSQELREQLDPQERTRIEILFSEEYPGHRTAPEAPLCQSARRAVAEGMDISDNGTFCLGGFQGFNSGCESGLRATRQATPTLIWGPGSLAQAHGIDEFVRWSEVGTVARHFAALAIDWCGTK